MARRSVVHTIVCVVSSLALALATLSLTGGSAAADEVVQTEPDFVTQSRLAETFEVDVAANDTGLGDTPLTFAMSTPPPAPWSASFGDPGSGVLSVSRDPGTDPGWYFELEYTVTDADGDTHSAWVFVDLLDPVTAVSDSFQVAVDAVTTLDVLRNDSTLSGMRTVTITVPPTSGSATVNPDGSIEYTPNPGYVGSDALEYRLDDGDGHTADATVFLDVVEPLELANDEVSTVRGEPATIDPLANDFVLAGPATVGVSTAPAHGTAVLDPMNDQQVVYTPDADYVGADQIGYTVTDAEGRTASGVIDVTVTNAITSSGPLTRIVVDDDLNCAVNHVADEAGEFFDDTACGTFLAVDGTVYSPAVIPAGQPGTPWTSVDQTELTGNGTQASPFRYTTTVAAGDSGVQLVQTDSYVIGQESYRTDIRVTNTGAQRTVRLYRAGDCYLADSDHGLGSVDPETGAVACVSSQSERVEQFLPLSAGSRYYEAGYDEIWSWINTMEPFPNTCRCAEEIDNGAGLSWDIVLPSGGEATRSSLITFSPTGAVPLAASTTVDPGTTTEGGTVTYTVTVSNPGASAAELTSITDLMPDGFGYVAGTTSGATTSDPVVDGQELTWTLPTPVTVPASGEVSLAFDAVASTVPGTYFNNVSALAVDTFVSPSGPSAELVVGGPSDTGPPGDVTDLLATPRAGEVALSWTNPTDADLANIVVRYVEGATPPTGPNDGLPVTLSDPLAQDALVSGLTNDTLYSFAVFAVDTSGNSSPGVSTSATPFAESVFVPPVFDLIGSSADGTAQLSWQNPEGIDGLVVRYSTVEYPASPTDGVGVPVTGLATTAEVTGLSNGTTYYFSVFTEAGTDFSVPESVVVTPAICPDLVPALDAGGLASSGEWVSCTSPAAHDGASSLDTPGATTGTSQALMTTGSAAGAAPPDDEDGTTTAYGTGFRGGRDVSIYRVDLQVPAGVNCLSIDMAFGTEEYDEYLGQSFNDAFIAELDQSTWSVDDSSALSPITAPNNFATDANGNLMSVNSLIFADPSRVVVGGTNGTEYDGMTPRLTASTPVTAGPHSLYLSIFDAGDDVLDSGVFLDNLRAFDQSGGCSEGLNQAPVADDESVTVDTGAPTPVDVADGDSDPDGDPLTYDVTSGPSHGAVSCTQAGVCTYTSEVGYVGADSFTYRARDDRGGSDIGTVDITVVQPNRAPVADNESMTTETAVPKSVDVATGDTDADGDALSFAIETQPSHGSASCTPAGVCTYTSGSGYTGGDSFTYVVSDGALTDIGTVTVTVVAPNRAPVADDESVTVDTGVSMPVDVSDGDSDPDGDPLTYELMSEPAHGAVSCTGAGVCTYTSEIGYVGADSFTYRVSDHRGGSDIGTVDITVVQPNRAPVADEDALVTDTGVPASVNVADGDSDPDGDVLSFAVRTQPAHGSASCTSAGVCSYTSDAGYAGADSFTYTVSDGALSTTGTVSVTVEAPDLVAQSITITTSTGRVVWPRVVTIRGQVVSDTGADYAGRPVELWGRPWGRGYQLLQTVTSSATGAVTAEEGPSTLTTYQWRIPESTVVSPERDVRVRPLVSIGTDARYASVRDRVVVSGRITPVRTDAMVRLQRFRGGRWRTILTTTPTRSSTAATLANGAPYRFVVGEQPTGNLRYRVVVAAHGGRTAVTSATRTIGWYAVRMPRHRSTGDEFVTIHNNGRVTVNLRDWTITTAAGIQLRLPRKQLVPGASVRVHPGAGRSDAQNIYLRRGASFRNAHDTLRLRDRQGVLVAVRRY